MGQINIGNLFIEMGYGANTNGRSKNTSTTTSNASFYKTLNETKTSFERANDSNQVKKNTSKDKFEPNVKQYEKNNDMDTIKDEKMDQYEADSMLKEEDEARRQANDSQILILVSQGLNLSVDDIQEALEKLSLEIKDLKTQEGFGIFIGEICGQGSIAELLTNTDDLKSITTLFEDLSGLDGEVQINAHQDTVQQTQMTLLQQEELNGDNIMSVQEVDQIQSDEKVIALDIKTTDDYEENNEASNQNLNLLQEEQNGEMEFGVSVNHFTTTFVQNLETDMGIVTQTTTKTRFSGTVIMEQIDFKVLGQTKEINLHLSPKELGDLNIKIIENNSALVAEIKVDNEKAKELILSEMHQLKENLESQGLTITDVTVDIRQGNQKSHMEQERQKSSKRIQEIISKHLAEIEEEEAVSIQMTSEIDYMV